MLTDKLHHKHRHTDQVQYGSRGPQLRVSSARPRTRESRVYSRVFMHSWTRTRIPRVKPREKTRALALETYPYKGVGLYPAQLALLVTLKTRATKLPCSPEGQVQCVTNLGEKHCLWAWHNYYASSVKNFSCSAHTCQFFAGCSSR